MMENHLYNLYHQLVQEHKSLWRIQNMYKEDAGDCASCAAFWEKLEKDKEDHIKELQQLIESHQ